MPSETTPKSPTLDEKKEKNTTQTDFSETSKKTQEKIREISREELGDISHSEFLLKNDFSKRLDKVTKPPKNYDDVKLGDKISFNFSFNGKENRELYLKTTAGQLLPPEVKEIKLDGETYTRNTLKGEFFKIGTNKRLIIHTGTTIEIGNLREKDSQNPDSISSINKANEEKYNDFISANPNSNTELVREAILRGIDPKLALIAFKDLKPEDLEDAFTEYDRQRGSYNYNENSDEQKLGLIMQFSKDWKKTAKDYGIKEDIIKSAETNGNHFMGFKSNDIKNSDSLPDGTYLKGEKLLQNPEFSKKLDEVCKSIGANREDLIKVMKAESGLDPRAVNSSSKATGLIQFMPATARGLGTSVGSLRAMTGVEQLTYVEKYFKQYSNKYSLNSIENLYKAVFYPASLGKGDNYIFGRSDVARQNPIIAKFSTRTDGLIDGRAFSRYVKNHVERVA